MARATLSRPATVERRSSKRWTISAQNGGAVTIRGTTTGDRTLRSTTSYLRGTEHEHLPAEFLNGRLIVKEYRAEPVIFTRVSRLTEELYFGLRVSFLPVLAIELSPLAG